MTASAESLNPGASNGTARPPLRPGVYVPTVAFFTSSDTVHDEHTTSHAARLARAGVAGLVTHGSNGEAVHLSHRERQHVNRLTRAALDEAGYAHLPLLVGCGAQSTRETIELCEEAAASGGSYALVLPPSYYSGLVPRALLLEHFRIVADKSPIPVLIYNFPGAANGVDLDSDAILELARHPNIAGVKLTCGNTGKLARVADSAKPGFLTTGGSADFILQTLVVGGQGVIAGLANLAPRACVRVIELFAQGKAEEARKLQALVARGDWVAIKGGFVAVKIGLRAYAGLSAELRRPCALPDKVAAAEVVDGFAELMEVEKSLE